MKKVCMHSEGVGTLALTSESERDVVFFIKCDEVDLFLNSSCKKMCWRGLRV